MRQDDIDRQIAMRNSRGYKLASIIVDLMGVVGDGTISESDTVGEAIEKLKAQMDKHRTRLY